MTMDYKYNFKSLKEFLQDPIANAWFRGSLRILIIMTPNEINQLSLIMNGTTLWCGEVERFNELFKHYCKINIIEQMVTWEHLPEHMNADTLLRDLIEYGFLENKRLTIESAVPPNETLLLSWRNHLIDLISYEVYKQTGLKPIQLNQHYQEWINSLTSLIQNTKEINIYIKNDNELTFEQQHELLQMISDLLRPSSLKKWNDLSEEIDRSSCIYVVSTIHSIMNGFDYLPFKNLQPYSFRCKLQNDISEPLFNFLSTQPIQIDYRCFDLMIIKWLLIKSLNIDDDYISDISIPKCYDSNAKLAYNKLQEYVLKMIQSYQLEQTLGKQLSKLHKDILDTLKQAHNSNFNATYHSFKAKLINVLADFRHCIEGFK